MSYQFTEQLAELIDRKHQCLLQLRDLGNQQAAFAAEGNLSDLLQVLAAKQQLIQLLQRLEQALEPYRHDEPDRRRWRQAEQRASCTRQAEDCRRLLAEILTQEKQSEAQMTLRRDEVARQLQGAHSAQQTRSAYTQQVGLVTGMLDLSSNA